MNHLSDETLSHSHHVDKIRWMLTGPPENDEYFLAEAAEMHALTVTEAVNDLRLRAVREGQGRQARTHFYAHLVYGVGRRTGDIWHAMRQWTAVSPVTRRHPLSSDEATLVSTALNTIYINIRGALDNFAWAAIENAGGLAAVGLNHMSVDLFGDRFSRVPAFGGLGAELGALADWSRDVKNRRNPAAHRIPLAVVSAVLTAEQAAEVRRLTAEMLVPAPGSPGQAGDYEQFLDRHEMLKKKIAGIGVYRPYFAHMPDEGAMPLYPTVAEDLGHMVRAGRIVLAHLGGGGGAHLPPSMAGGTGS